MTTLYRKYRPKTFAEVTDQEHVKRILQNELRDGAVAHAYLFTGPRGVGKTTLARLLAKAVNCETIGYQPGKKMEEKTVLPEPCNTCHACQSITEGSALDVFEIDAASHTGVDHVREEIIEQTRFAPRDLSCKVFIIDEVHMLSTSAFNALLKTLEEPPSHVIFILATTEIHKVPDTIISRCQRFDFKRIATNVLIERLRALIASEGVEVESTVLEEIARRSGGCLRDAESLLGQILVLSQGKLITLAEAAVVLPASTLTQTVSFISALCEQQMWESIHLVNTFIEQGLDLPYFIDDVIESLRVMMFVKLGDERGLKELFPVDMQKSLQDITARVPVSFLVAAIDRFLEAKHAGRSDALPQIPLEMAIMHLCLPAEEQVSVPVQSSPTKISSPKPPVEKFIPTPSSKTEPLSPAPPRSEESFSVQIESEPIPVITTAFDQTIPVVNLEDIRRHWPEVFMKLEESHASLPLVLKAGEIEGIEGDRVNVGFEYTFHADRLNEKKNKHLIEEVLEGVFGKRIQFQAVHRKRSPQEADQAIGSLLDAFGGSVV